LARDAMLKIVFKFLVAETSLAWMYDYGVELKRSAVPPSA
jgi:hypothetical protein